MGEVINFPIQQDSANYINSEYEREFLVRVVEDTRATGTPTAEADAAMFRRMLIAIKNTKQT